MIVTGLCVMLVPVLAYAQAAAGKALKWAVQHGSEFVPVVEQMGRSSGKVASQFGDDAVRYGGYAAHQLTKDDDDSSVGTIVLVVAGVVVVGLIVKKASS